MAVMNESVQENCSNVNGVTVSMTKFVAVRFGERLLNIAFFPTSQVLDWHNLRTQRTSNCSLSHFNVQLSGGVIHPDINLLMAYFGQRAFGR